LVAPNHFHHLSLPRFRQRYPDAVVVAGERALPRLRRKGHQGVAPLQDAASLLPPDVSLWACAGCKTGESWLCDERGGVSRWVVGDAFFNMPGPLTGLMGWFMGVLQVGPGLSLGRTFRWLGLDDEAGFRSWLSERLASAPPSWLGFSHGAPIEGDDVGARLTALVRERLGE
jgi:hypothetical protein